jgi:tyrosyl-tRNA synthetase
MGKVITDEKKIDELLARGVEDVIEREHLEKALLSGKQLRVKLGIDPTSADLHLGHGVVLRKLKAFQDLGHKVVFIVGDFTARIGDPSDKLSKRPMLKADKIKKNLANYKKQVGQIIDLKRAEFKFNSKWLKKLDFNEIAELAESFTVGQMLARRNFKERHEKGEEISTREFMYPLMQGYDSVAVKADVELGGFDQLFNLKAGREIQKHYGQESQDILTTSMLEGSDGRKMSTSWGNVINIVDEPNEMFGKVMSIKDELIEKYLWLCTDLDKDSIAGILEADGNPKNQKAWLAFEVVKLYHGEEEAGKAQTEFGKVFSQGESPSDLRVAKIKENHVTLLDLVLKVEGIKSKSEARRIIGQGGVKVNGEQVMNANKPMVLEAEILLQVGKRRFAKFIRG